MLTWQGFSFELLCLLHLEQLKYKLHIDVISNHSSSWRSSDPDNPAQIDLVIERGDRIINLCEMKFASSPYTIDKDYEMRLRERIGLFVHQTHTRCGIHITMVTTFGTVPNFCQKLKALALAWFSLIPSARTWSPNSIIATESSISLSVTFILLCFD